jgi:hypothetical protein
VRARPSRLERPAQGSGAMAVESRDRAAQVPDVVGVAARGDGQHPFDVPQRRPGVVGRREHARVVDDLDRVEGQVGDHARDRDVAPVGTADGMERVRRDRRPALGVDLLDGAERREARGHPRLEKEAEEMAVEGADLLADDDVDPEFRVVQREVARQQGPANLVMVGDGDDVEPPARGGDDRLRALGPVAPQRMHAEICAPTRQDTHRSRVCTGGVKPISFCP